MTVLPAAGDVKVPPAGRDRPAGRSAKTGRRLIDEGCAASPGAVPELQRLLWADVRLEAPCEFIEVRTAIAKNRRSAMIPLVPLLVDLLKAQKGTGAGLVLEGDVPSAKTLAKDLTAAGIPVIDERGWRVDFHALRHSFASYLATAGVPEAVRMKLTRHSAQSMVNNYTDPLSLPIFAGIEKLSLLLPSSIASLKAGKTCPNVGNTVQDGPPPEVVQAIDFRSESEFLGKAFPSWENSELAPPRGALLPRKKSR